MTQTEDKLKFNFWEQFAFTVAIGALEALIGQSTSLTVKQQADLTAALTAVQQVESDFAS